MLFGSCTICLNAFRMGYDVSHIHCKSEMELIFPIIEIIFMSVQVTGLPHTHTSGDTQTTQPTLKPATEVTSPCSRVWTYTNHSLPPCTHSHTALLCTCAPPHIPIDTYKHLHLDAPACS